MGYKQVSPQPVSEGGTGASTLTDHGVLIGSGTSAISATGTGTSGQVLTSNGASADPTFQDATGSLILLDAQVLNAVSEVKFTNIPNSSFRYLVIKARLEASNSVALQLRTSNDNGSTYQTSGYLPSSAAQISLGNLNSTYRHNLQLEISNQQSNYMLISGWINNPGSSVSVTTGQSASTGNNAIKIYPASGTITGHIALWEYSIS